MDPQGSKHFSFITLEKNYHNELELLMIQDFNRLKTDIISYRCFSKIHGLLEEFLKLSL